MYPRHQLQLIKGLFNEHTQIKILGALRQEIPWKQESIKMFGKTHPTPRLTSWHGNEGCKYTYSGLICNPEPWSPTLLSIKQRIVEAMENANFNSVLLNLYRNGQDKMGWHSDDEKELGPNPIIASVSFGATRRFDFKHKTIPEHKFSIDLPSGSLLIMQGDLQDHWLHQLPAQKRIIEPRINLTFRNIISP
ncbi:MAG: alpha-ketoglutarate-dependent dioxygenase AlkB [Flavobacteriales bacterium]|nr:alpha-ketoglutarate-dependent dioxygenase AlkB [Flavobacteriaceae bacterium]PHX91684.1 MAG: alpha-ketoglutarate-dependent dioxygenase AlkB [Flavobacteriales bacterium]